ncbi:MAG: restriction endonuclease subunit S, partial [Anaerolineaceae bacterium]
IPLITAKIVKGGRILEPTEFIPYEDYDERMQRGIPESGDVVITTEAPLGEVGQLDNRKLSVGQRLITLRGKKGLLDNTYLKFLLMSEFVQNQLSARETGTTVSGIKQAELRKIDLLIPPLPTPRRIAEILSALDDKIELNRQTNATLEAIAQAIFKEWFVDFNFPGASGEMVESELGMIPRGWRVGKLGEIFNITMGQSPPGESYNENGIGIPFFQGRADFTFRFPEKRVYTTDPKRLANQFDTLVSVRAPVGDMNIASEDCCIGRGLAAVAEINGNSSFTYY